MDDYDIFDTIRIEASNAIGLNQDKINELKHKLGELETENKRLKTIVKQTYEPTPNGSKASSKPAEGIRLATRQQIMDAVRELDGENTNFTIAQLVETSKLAESTVARSVKVLRDEGMVRMVGKEGMAPVYRWVGG